MENRKTLYLSSLDSVRLEEVRECKFERFIHFNTGKAAAIVQINPEFQLEVNNNWHLLNSVILTARHEGGDIKNIKEFPFFVHVAYRADDCANNSDEITADNLYSIGVGELYETALNAKNHIFSKPKTE